MMGGHGGVAGPGGPPAQEWQTDAFRTSLVRKLEEAIRESGNKTEKTPMELERQVFQRSSTKEEYLGYVARLILHVRQQGGAGPAPGQGDGGMGEMMGGLGGLGPGAQPGMRPGGPRPMMAQQMPGQQMSLQQQRMMLQQQRMMQMQAGRGGHPRQPGPGQAPGMSQLAAALGRGGPRHPPHQLRAPPPGYMVRGPSPGPGQPSASPAGYANSPSPVQQQGGSLAPSPSSGVNTPQPPASQEDREYLDKVKSLEKYIEPLRKMIAKIGTENDQDRLSKMKKLLDILSNPDKRMPIATLQKCEDVLKRMGMDIVDQESEAGGGNLPGPTSLNPLLEAVIKTRQGSNTSNLNHALSTAVRPGLDSLLGRAITVPGSQQEPESEEEEDEEVPDVLQGEIARLEPRYKVWISPGQPAGERELVLVCQLEDAHLPAVPPLEVSIPADYPAQPPRLPSGQDFLHTPFLQRVEAALASRLGNLPARHTLSQLLTAWELSVRAACSPLQTGPGPGSALLSGL